MLLECAREESVTLVDNLFDLWSRFLSHSLDPHAGAPSTSSGSREHSRERFKIQDEFELELPVMAEIVKVAVQKKNSGDDRKFCMWVLLDTEDEIDTRKIYVVGTGHPAPEDAEYVETFFDDHFVWHLFQEQ